MGCTARAMAVVMGLCTILGGSGCSSSASPSTTCAEECAVDAGVCCGPLCADNPCDTGCCTAAGACQVGDRADACGAEGGLCNVCTAEQFCNQSAGTCQGLGAPVPTDDLPAYFAAQGIANVGPFEYAGVGEDFLYIEYPDPDDDQTMAAFFEIETGTALNTDGMHFAASLRGPDPSRTIPYYGGRGIAFGDLSSFANCSGIGYFLEDFARNTLTMPEMQMTYCNDHSFTSSTTYRVDMRVSKTNTYVAIWRKVDAATYFLEVETQCESEPGPLREIGPCPEHESDTPFGGFFVGAGFAAPTDTWQIRDAYIAHW